MGTATVPDVPAGVASFIAKVRASLSEVHEVSIAPVSVGTTPSHQPTLPGCGLTVQVE